MNHSYSISGNLASDGLTIDTRSSANMLEKFIGNFTKSYFGKNLQNINYPRSLALAFIKFRSYKSNVKICCPCS